MSTSTFGLSAIDTPVTEAQRDRSADYLQRAYAEGRIGPQEFEDRIGQVLKARTRRELNAAFAGLARIPITATLSTWQRPDPSVPRGASRALAAVTHLSATGTWAVGPAVAYAMAPQGSWLKRQAARSFNFQVVAGALFVAMAMLGVPGVWMAVGAMGWFLLTLMGAARAAAGEDWRNPVTAVLPFRFLDEGPRRRALTR